MRTSYLEFELIAIFFNPALRLSVTVQISATNKNNQETKQFSQYRLFSRNSKFSKYQVFRSKYLAFVNSGCEKPSISTFLIRNT